MLVIILLLSKTSGKLYPGFGENCFSRESAMYSDLSLDENMSPLGPVRRCEGVRLLGRNCLICRLSRLYGRVCL